MYRSQQLDSLLPNSWLASDKLEMDDGEILLCTENVYSSPIRSSVVVRLIFMIVIGLAQPTPSAVILGTQLPVSSGQIGSYQGGKLEAPYINRVISKENDTNDGVAYSILEAYNGIQEEEDVREGETHMRKDATMLIYSVLGFCGVLMLVTSGLSAYVVPLYDQGAAKVLFPMSFAFLSMIGIKYLFRSENHA